MRNDTRGDKWICYLYACIRYKISRCQQHAAIHEILQIHPAALYDGEGGKGSVRTLAIHIDGNGGFAAAAISLHEILQHVRHRIVICKKITDIESVLVFVEIFNRIHAFADGIALEHKRIPSAAAVYDIFAASAAQEIASVIARNRSGGQIDYYMRNRR